MKLGWQKVEVWLCGIAALQLSQPLGVKSQVYLRQLIASAGNQVILYSSESDRYDRKLAEVFVSTHSPQN